MCDKIYMIFSFRERLGLSSDVRKSEWVREERERERGNPKDLKFGSPKMDLFHGDVNFNKRTASPPTDFLDFASEHLTFELVFISFNQWSMLIPLLLIWKKMYFCIKNDISFIQATAPKTYLRPNIFQNFPQKSGSEKYPHEIIYCGHPHNFKILPSFL